MPAIGRLWPSDDDDDADDANLHVTVLLLEHGALPLGRQQEGQEPRHGKAGDEIVVFLYLSS